MSHSDRTALPEEKRTAGTLAVRVLLLGLTPETEIWPNKELQAIQGKI
jgi:hypothetical protein